LVAARQVSVARWAWTDPVRLGAFPEERLAGPGQRLDQDARGEIVQVVLRAADLRASARSVRQSQEMKNPQPDASRQAQMVVPESCLERLTGELEEQAVARLAPQKAARPAELQPELSRRLARLAVAREQSELLQAERCWPRVSLLARPAHLQ
jgi:hypothetical protein